MTFADARGSDQSRDREGAFDSKYVTIFPNRSASGFLVISLYCHQTMAISRRELLAGIAMAASGYAQETPPPGPRVPRPRALPKPRTSPAVCLYSQQLIKVEFESLGMVLRDMGFDGCDLACLPGAHVPPERAGAELMRAIEAVAGAGLEETILTTGLTN